MKSQPQKLGLAALVVVMLLAAAVVIAPSRFPPAAQAATPNLAPGFGVMVLPLHLAGAYTSTTTAATFNMPMPCAMLGVGAAPRTVSLPSVAVDVQLGGASILASPIELSTGTYSEGTISTAAISDEGVMTVIVNTPMANSSVSDLTVLLTCARK